MFKALRFFWHNHRVALIAFLLALTLVIVFSLRFLLNFIYFHDPAHRNQALEPWMTPRYVAMSYRLPRPVIREIMQLERFEGRKVTLDEVSEKLGMSLTELEKKVRAAARAHKDAKRNADPKTNAAGKAND